MLTENFELIATGIEISDFPYQFQNQVFHQRRCSVRQTPAFQWNLPPCQQNYQPVGLVWFKAEQLTSGVAGEFSDVFSRVDAKPSSSHFTYMLLDSHSPGKINNQKLYILISREPDEFNSGLYHSQSLAILFFIIKKSCIATTLYKTSHSSYHNTRSLSFLSDTKE